MRISVVIPAHNAAGTLQRCLDALGRSGWQDFECVVVNDASGDSTDRVAEAWGAVTLNNPEVRGPAACRNLGAHKASSEILLFIDADVCVRPDTLARVVQRFEQDPELDGVFGSYDDAPTGSIASRYRNLLHHHAHQNGAEWARTFWAGCGGLRRSSFVRCGGFDESYRTPSIEDIELGYRVTDAGGRIRLDREMLVRHLKQWTIPGILRTDILQRAVPWSRLLWRRRSMPADLNVNWGARICGVLVWVAAMAVVALATGLPPLLPALAASASLVGMIAINRDFYALLCRVGGPLLLLGSLPLHLAYFAYSTAAFAWVVLTEGVRRPPLRTPAPRR